MCVEKDWEARFKAPPNTDRQAIVIILALFAIVLAPFFFPIYIFLLVGLFPALLVSFVMRKLGRRPLSKIWIAAIAICVWVTLSVWWLAVWGDKPFDPPL